MSSSLIQTTLTSQEQMAISNYINLYRTKNQAPPIIWDNSIAAFSQEWSHHLDASNVFVHSNTQTFGENLAFYQGYGTDKMTLLRKAVDNWYNEIAFYDFKNPGFSESTGHFTCLVWKSSVLFGMGITINPETTAAVVVLNTSPPGNVIGQFKQNVLPVLGSIPISTQPNQLPISPNPPNASKPPQPTSKEFIINGIHNLLHQLRTKQSNKVLSVTISYIIDKFISTPNQDQKILNDLYYIQYMIQSNEPNKDIIAKLNSLLYELINE